MSPVTDKTDVLVIGSGPGGAIPAYRLAAAGAKVTILERGPWLETGDFTHDLRIDTYTRIVDYITADGVSVVAGNCVGGSSVIYFAGALRAPTFVRDFPVETSPLTRDHRTARGLVEKWDLYVRGFELATAYSELVDPVIQRQRFEAQALLAAAGDDEAMVLDEDFLAAMEYAMPPAGGMGMGIDRLLMALTGLGIRETILFPLVK